jgi:hypothetical protein
MFFKSRETSKRCELFEEERIFITFKISAVCKGNITDLAEGSQRTVARVIDAKNKGFSFFGVCNSFTRILPARTKTLGAET